jgi:hypothetical protein
MLATVKFDGQPAFATEEVTNERTDWHLARELKTAKLTSAEVTP